MDGTPRKRGWNRVPPLLRMKILVGLPVESVGGPSVTDGSSLAGWTSHWVVLAPIRSPSVDGEGVFPGFPLPNLQSWGGVGEKCGIPPSPEGGLLPIGWTLIRWFFPNPEGAVDSPIRFPGLKGRPPRRWNSPSVRRGVFSPVFGTGESAGKGAVERSKLGEELVSPLSGNLPPPGAKSSPREVEAGGRPLGW